MGNNACYQVLQPEFDAQDTHSGRREATPTSCPLTSLCMYHGAHRERQTERQRKADTQTDPHREKETNTCAETDRQIKRQR